MWAQVLDTEEVIAYEKQGNELDIRIEARQEKDQTWKVYMKYISSSSQKINYTEEYDCEDIDKAREMISCLTNSKLKTLKEIAQIKVDQKRELKIDIKRTTRDYSSETWTFRINQEEFTNRILIKESDFIDVDVILSEIYRIHEDKILQRLISMLGLSNQQVRTKITVYYCKDQAKYFLEEGYLENIQKMEGN